MACQHATPVEGCPDCGGTFLKSAVPSDATVTRGTGPGEPPADWHFPTRGTQVGRYVLLDQVGEGAMGMVFAAWDPELDRKIAIKLLRPARTDAGVVSTGQTRLLREAQAMAKLSDPNVVPIYDAGTFQDGVFLAMELVEGQTLRQWMQGAQPTWREVLRVFRQAGQGLSAAHRAGIIHRDFKPANVLVGADGRARVGDFGIARASGDADVLVTRTQTPAVAESPAVLPPANGSLGTGRITGLTPLSAPLTEAGSIMGTPGYMGPEQCAGELATAQTDQFSFCASLYEALFHRLPFAGGTLPEVSAATRAGQVVPPPKDSRVPGWVVRIVLRGLSVRPEDRFASMDALLAALAKDPAAARRRWLAVGAAGVALAGLGVGARAWLQRLDQRCQGAPQKLAGVWDTAARARVKEGLEATHLPFVDVTWGVVQGALDRYSAQWATAFTEACQETRIRGEQSEQAMDLKMACLEESRQSLIALTGLLAKADGKIAENSIAATRALPPLERCADVATLSRPAALPADPAVRAPIEAVRKELARARAQNHLGKYPDTRSFIQQAIVAARATQHEPVIAEALELAAETESSLSDTKAALPDFQAAFASAQRARRDDLAAKALLGLANVQGVSMSHPEQGLDTAALVPGVLERAGRLPRLEAELHRTLGALNTQAGFPDVGILELRQAVALREKLAEPLELAGALANLGWALLDRGDISGAREVLTRGMSLRLAEVGPDHPALLASYNEMSRLEQSESNFDEAASYLNKGAALAERVFGPKNRRVCVFVTNLTNSFIGAEHWSQAVEQGRRGAALCGEILAKDHPDLAISHLLIGVALRGAGKPREGLEEHRGAQAYLERVGAAHPPFYCMVQREQGEDLLAVRRAPDALRMADQAIACFGKDKVEGSRMSESLMTRGRALTAMGKSAEALPTLRRALDLVLAAKEGLEDQAEAEFALAQALWKSQPREARQFARQAQEKYETRKRAPHVTEVAAWLAHHR